ncbi:MAG: PadR family transcriptional regulator [Edaphobacter sp.]
MKPAGKNPPLSPATLHILLALAAEDRHGYGIIQEIHRQSNGHYKLGPGTLYDNLKKLMDQNVVIDAPRNKHNAEEERRLYRLTPAGRAILSLEIDRLQGVVRSARLSLRERKPKNA